MAGAGGFLSVRLDLRDQGLRFRAPLAGYVLATLLIFGWVLALGGMISAFTHSTRPHAAPEQIALLVILIVLGALIARVVASGTLIADTDGVVCRTVLRTFRWSWSEIEGFEEVVKPIGASGVPRRFLRVRLSSGRSRNLTELNASRRDDPDIIGHLVSSLESLRAAHRH